MLLVLHVQKRTMWYGLCVCVCARSCVFTSKVQIVGGVNDNPHKGEVESSHFGSDLRFITAVVKIMGT